MPSRVQAIRGAVRTAKNVVRGTGTNLATGELSTATKMAASRAGRTGRRMARRGIVGAGVGVGIGAGGLYGMSRGGSSGRSSLYGSGRTPGQYY